MAQQAGFSTVVMGGQPRHGPMKRTDGTRAANVYSADTLDNDFLNAEILTRSARVCCPAVTTQAWPSPQRPSHSGIRSAQPIARPFRSSSRTTPPTAAWDAGFSSPSLCIPDSTGYTTKSTATAPPPKATAVEPKLPSLEFGYDVDPIDGMADSPRTLSTTAVLEECNPKYSPNTEENLCYPGMFA